MPRCIVQDTVTKKEVILRSKGDDKCATLVGDPEYNDLVAISCYDFKPVYFFSNPCKKVEWMKKDRKLYHKIK